MEHSKAFEISANFLIRMKWKIIFFISIVSFILKHCQCQLGIVLLSLQCKSPQQPLHRQMRSLLHVHKWSTEIIGIQIITSKWLSLYRVLPKSQHPFCTLIETNSPRGGLMPFLVQCIESKTWKNITSLLTFQIHLISHSITSRKKEKSTSKELIYFRKHSAWNCGSRREQGRKGSRKGNVSWQLQSHTSSTGIWAIGGNQYWYGLLLSGETLGPRRKGDMLNERLSWDSPKLRHLGLDVSALMSS